MGYRGYGYGYGDMMGGGGFGAFLMFLFFLLVVAAVVALVVWAVRQSRTQHATGGTTMHPAEAGHHEAVAIAKKRLASGEITKDQYDEIIRALNS